MSERIEYACEIKDCGEWRTVFCTYDANKAAEWLTAAKNQGVQAQVNHLIPHTERAGPCDCCAPYGKPGFILNAYQWLHCPQCNQQSVSN